MPLIVLTGQPLSGKSTVAKRLKACFENYFQQHQLKHGCTILHDTDYMPSSDLNALYMDVAQEKILRGAMKAAIEKSLDNSCILILDALNYIKGQRYELYCIAKANRTTACTVYCACTSLASDSTSTSDSSAKYRREVLDALILRYEAPDSRNRWDHPLFTVTDVDNIPFEEIRAAIFVRKPPPPNQSTQVQPISATDFLQEFDRTTRSVVDIIWQNQQTCGGVACGDVKFPGSEEVLNLNRKVNSAELARIRRQFLAYSRSRPVDELTKQNIATLFVKYLQQSLA